MGSAFLQSVCPTSGSRKARRGKAISIALATYAVGMCGTTMPTPLYPMLQDNFGMSTALSTQLFAIYAFTVLLVLCFFGTISDAVGRKPVLLGALVSSIASGILYVMANDVSMLFIARTLSGVCAGLLAGTATAYITDLEDSSARGAGMSSAANMIGLGAGPLFAATLTYLVPNLPMVAFGSHAMLSGFCVFMLAMIPETVSSRSHKLRLSLPLIPRSALRDFTVGGLMALGFAVMGGCTAITSILIVKAFGITDIRILGLTGSLIFIATTIGQKFGSRFVASKAGAGFGALAVGAVLIGLAPMLTTPVAIPTYLLGLTLAGLSHGALFPIGLGIVLRRIEVSERASASSAFWVLGYALTAAGAMGLGWAGSFVGETTSVAWFGGSIAVSAVGCAFIHTRLTRDTDLHRDVA